jgi:uncharacterized protein YegP (UPF0339 family)
MNTYKTTIEMYRDVHGEYRWRMKAANNKIIADSAESYGTYNSLHRAATQIVDRMSAGNVKLKIKKGTRKF